jgi:hypothetical protein
VSGIEDRRLVALNHLPALLLGMEAADAALDGDPGIALPVRRIHPAGYEDR